MKNLFDFGAKTPSTEEVKKPRANSENLLVSELEEGKIYACYLSGDRKVQYVGNGIIRWYNHEHDEYREAYVNDYQLRHIKTNLQG